MPLTREQQSRLYNILIIVGIVVIVGVLFLFSRGNRFLKYQHPQQNFKMIYPDGWEVMENYEGAAVVFRSKLVGDLDSFQEAVNVVVDKTPYSPMDLTAYTDLAIRQMQAVFKVNVEILSQEDVLLSGLSAKRFTYVIRFGNINIKYLSVWAVAGKNAIQITYSAEDNQFDQHLAKAEKMIKSLSFSRL